MVLATALQSLFQFQGVATIGSAKLFEAFSASQYAASQGELDKTTNNLKVFAPTVDASAG